MNYLDLLIAIPLGFAVFKGLRKGLIVELASLASLFIGVYAGIYFSDYVAGLLIKNFGLNEVYTKAIAFSMIFIAVIVIIRLIAKAIEKLIDLTALGFVNKLLGALFSALKIALIISVIFFVFSRFDSNEWVISRQAKEKSILYKPLSSIAPFCIPRMKKEIDKWQNSKKEPQEKNQSENTD